MMEYEMKMAEIRKKNEEKLNFQKEKEYEREKEIIKTRKQVLKHIISKIRPKYFFKLQQEEIKRKQDYEKQRKLEEDLLVQKQKALEQYEKEQEKQKSEKQKELERMKESKRREEEQKQKQEEFKKQTEALLKEQQDVIEAKKYEMAEKDRARKEVILIYI